MSRAASGRLGPWVGSVVVHAAVIAALAVAAVKWRTDPPPEQLAIQGNVVRYEDLPSSVKAGKPLREATPVPTAAPTPVPVVRPDPVPEPQPKPEPMPEPKSAPPVEDRTGPDLKRQAEAQAKAEAAAVQRRKAEQAAADQKARDAAALEARERAEAEEQRRLEDERKQAAADARLKQEEQARAALEAKARAAKEAELRRALEDEEAGDAFARSGVVDEYRTLLTQTIQRNWIRPGSARPGLECTLYVTQATGGTVLDVKIGECNGDQAVRESVANAVFRSSPLPPPRDARAFERRLVIVFKPTE
jgi:colicin import membrane protein